MRIYKISFNKNEYYYTIVQLKNQHPLLLDRFLKIIYMQNAIFSAG
jgi:hypothetical protein